MTFEHCTKISFNRSSSHVPAGYATAGEARVGVVICSDEGVTIYCTDGLYPSTYYGKDIEADCKNIRIIGSVSPTLKSWLQDRFNELLQQHLEDDDRAESHCSIYASLFASLGNVKHVLPNMEDGSILVLPKETPPVFTKVGDFSVGSDHKRTVYRDQHGKLFLESGYVLNSMSEADLFDFFRYAQID